MQVPGGSEHPKNQGAALLCSEKVLTPTAVLSWPMVLAGWRRALL